MRTTTTAPAAAAAEMLPRRRIVRDAKGRESVLTDTSLLTVVELEVGRSVEASVGDKDQARGCVADAQHIHKTRNMEPAACYLGKPSRTFWKPSKGRLLLGTTAAGCALLFSKLPTARETGSTMLVVASTGRTARLGCLSCALVVASGFVCNPLSSLPKSNELHRNGLGKQQQQQLKQRPFGATWSSHQRRATTRGKRALGMVSRVFILR